MAEDEYYVLWQHSFTESSPRCIWDVECSCRLFLGLSEHIWKFPIRACNKISSIRFLHDPESFCIPCCKLFSEMKRGKKTGPIKMKLIYLIPYLQSEIKVKIRSAFEPSSPSVTWSVFIPPKIGCWLIRGLPSSQQARQYSFIHLGEERQYE